MCTAPSTTTQTIIVGLSGPSCSGKTTLACLLRNALSTGHSVLHEDDFYKTDAEIPVVRTDKGQELQDWDCLGSIDLDSLESMLLHIQRNGRIKPGFKSKEDQNSVGEVPVDSAVVESYTQRIREVLSQAPAGFQIVIVDGFLLFSEEMKRIRELFDIKLLLTTDYATVKRRREARKGYVTLEGFWEDPPGYVDLIVWPNFVKDHKFLFKNGNVEGDVDEELCQRLGIQCMPKDAVENMTKSFEWAVDVISEQLKQLFGSSGQGNT